jgi:HSP20 family molecular chaperone IbpA
MSLTPAFRSEVNDTARRVNSLFGQLDSLFTQCPVMNDNSLVQRGVQPLVVHDDEKETHLRVDVPGVVKDNLKVTYEGRNLRWNAHRENETQQEDGSKSKSVFDFSGMYRLPYTPVGVNATLRDGVLELVVTKPDQPEGTVVDVTVA